MDSVTLAAYCRAKPGAAATRPFGPDTLVFKVGGKIFAILAETGEPPTISLKCEPELAVLLRETHEAVTPGYHLNKRHWNTIVVDGRVDDREVCAWIDDSYDLIVERLPRKTRTALLGSDGTA